MSKAQSSAQSGTNGMTEEDAARHPAAVEHPDSTDPGDPGSQPLPWPRGRYSDAVPTMFLNSHHACNLRCLYCFAHPSESDYARPPMTLEVAKRAVDFLLADFSAHAPSCNIHSTLLGEPHLDQEFLQSLGSYIRARADHYGKRVKWAGGGISNLTVLPSEETLRHLEWVGVSLDGPPEIHNRLRRFPDGSGSYEVVLQQVRELTARGENGLGPGLGARATLTALDPDVTKVFLHLHELGFEYISIQPALLPPGHPGAIDSSGVEAVKAEYSRFVEFLLSQDPDRLLSYLRPMFEVSDFLGRFLIRALYPGKLPYSCPAGKWCIAVDSNGDIYPCAPFAAAQKYKLGSVFTGIDAQEQQFWVEELFIENRSSCASCSCRHMCGGGCYYQSFLTTGRADQPCPSRCDLTRHVADTALQMVAQLRARHPVAVTALPDPCQRTRPSARRATCTRFTGEFAAGVGLGKWRSPQPLRLADRSLVRWKCWRGPQDLSADVHLGWDEQHLHLRVDVRDDVFVPPGKHSRRQTGDSLEFSLRPLSSPVRCYDFTVSPFAEDLDLLARGEGVSLHCPQIQQTRAACNVYRQVGRIDYHLAIPWADIEGLSPGKNFGLSLRLNDDDGETRGYIEWPADAVYGLVSFAPDDRHAPSA